MTSESKVKINLSAVRNAIINYIIPIICLVATALVVIFILQPSYKSLPGLKTDLEAKTTLEVSLTKKLDVLNKLVEFKTVVDEDSQLVNKILVSEDMVPALLTQADKIATESGMYVARLSYSLASVMSGSSDSKAASSYKIVEINMGVDGNFEQLKVFLSSLEMAARMINVETLRYAADDEDGAISYSATLVLRSPYLFVESSAVTDEAIDLDISESNFSKLINKIKAMKFYDATEVNTSVEVIETPAVEETTPSAIFN